MMPRPSVEGVSSRSAKRHTRPRRTPLALTFPQRHIIWQTAQDEVGWKSRVRLTDERFSSLRRPWLCRLMKDRAESL